MNRQRRGATLIEVVVVVGIAAIVMGIVWLSEPWASRLALHAAARLLVSDLRTAQARAIADHQGDRGYGVVIRPGADRYLIFVREGQMRTPLVERRLPHRIRITYARFGGSEPTEVLFTGVSLFGAPSGGGTVTLTSGRARVCVRVMPATGRVRVAGTTCP